MKRTQLAIMVVGLGLAVQTNASVVNITFAEHDGGPTTASGTLEVVGGFATQGSLTVAYGDNNLGTYALKPGANINIYDTSVVFTWDGAVNTANPGGQFLNNNGNQAGGLVFTAGGNEFNLWYNLSSQYAPQGTYSLWGNFGGLSGIIFPQAYGSASITAVPEPSTYVAGALMLVPFGVGMIRKLRAKRTA